LPTPKSVCYISNNTYSASFDGTKECSLHGKIGSATGDAGKGREGTGIKEGEGGTGGALWQGGKRGEKEGEGG